VVEGFGDGTYGPVLAVNRAQMSAYIGRAIAGGNAFFETYDPPTSPSFPDVTEDGEYGWAYPYVEYIASEGVTGGYPDGLYHPEYPCTRDQMAVYVSRAFGYEFP
jgi:hypothetical protein